MKEKLLGIIRERLGKPDVQKYRKRIEEIKEILARMDKARRLLKDPKYRKKMAQLELERQLALLGEKYNVKVDMLFTQIAEDVMQTDMQAELRADKNPLGADCPTPIPEEAIHKVTDLSESWSMPNGAKVGPAITWYDKEKTKKKLLHCYNTRGKLHGYTIKWYISGLKQNKYDWKNGKKDGVHSTWYEQPYRPHAIKTFKDGKLDGISATWAEDGRRLSYNVYENNQLTKRTRFDSKGKPILEEIWSDGKLISITKLEADKK